MCREKDRDQGQLKSKNPVPRIIIHNIKGWQTGQVSHIAFVLARLDLSQIYVPKRAWMIILTRYYGYE